MAVFDAQQLNGIRPTTFSGVGYRNQTPGFDPRSGEGARRFGGRFNPTRRFPAVYLCTTRPCVSAELTAQADRQGIGLEDLLPREVWSLAMKLDRVLNLADDATRLEAGLARADLMLPVHAFTQQAGEAAHERGYQAIRTASATGVDDVLVVFPENLGSVTIDVDLVLLWEVPGDFP